MTKLLISIFLLVISVLLFIVYIQPTYSSAQSIKIKVSGYDEALTKTREIQQLKSSLLDKRNAFSASDLDRLHKMLPDHVDNVRLVLDLDGIAANYGIRIKNVGVQKNIIKGTTADNGVMLQDGKSQNKTYQSLTLTFTINASYEEFISLLRDLESSLRIVDLTELTIKPSTTSGLYTFGVSLRTYWLP